MTRSSITPKQLIRQSIPDLKVADNHTTFSAPHNVLFVGISEPWIDFEKDVLDQYESYDFHKRQLSATLRSQADLPLLGPNVERKKLVCKGDSSSTWETK
ncbi:hypothetical protein FE257_002689 [Aspergillus nanangensis]|uniref:Uncharacterized protein n=1 Tax=Aspergillus nanangensis TaxID=2582783 RepID=A0AAD4CCG0_ASPNN|nr:hypothetical protein FE257_002689 [Aspergillus nanangensis]